MRAFSPFRGVFLLVVSPYPNHFATAQLSTRITLGIEGYDYVGEGATPQCAAALIAPIENCPLAIFAAPNAAQYQLSELQELCSTSCGSSLIAYRDGIVNSCGGWLLIGGEEESQAFPNTWEVDRALFARDLACIKDANNNFCSLAIEPPAMTTEQLQKRRQPSDTPAEKRHGHIHGHHRYHRHTGHHLKSWSAPHIMKRQQAGGEEEEDLCDICFIQNLITHLNSPVGYDDGIESVYESLTSSSCTASTYTWTSPPPYMPGNGGAITTTTTTTANPTYTPVCAGTVIQVSGRTCQTISTTYGISTSALLESNGLIGLCKDFPETGSLCLPSNRMCTVHTVEATDTCLSIAEEYELPLVRLHSWNQEINLPCTNLNRLVGFQICVSNPRGTFVQVTATKPPLQLTTASTPAPIPTDIAPEVNTLCGRYHSVVEGEFCAILMQKYGISFDNFRFLNRQVNENCTNLWKLASYCVLPVGEITTYSGHPLSVSTLAYTPPATPWANLTATIAWDDFDPPDAPDDPIPFDLRYPLADETREDCALYRWNDAGIPSWTCESFMRYYDISEENLKMWNPSLGDPCLIQEEKRYCVVLSFKQYEDTGEDNLNLLPLVPANVQAGVVVPCYEWFEAMPGVTSCEILAELGQITLGQLYEWNPALGENCTGLWPQYNYCIWGPGFDKYPNPETQTPTTTTMTTSTITSTTATPRVPPPAPTQPGIVANCKAWHVVEPGGPACWDISVLYSITLQQLYGWNPALNGDCSGLWPGYAYCVGIAESTPITTTTTTPPTPTPTPPAPTQPGINKDCTAWFVAYENGPGCWDISVMFSITLQQLYDWNPALNGDCSGLWAKYAYCVAVS